MDRNVLWLAVPLALGYAFLFWTVSLRAPCVPLALIFGLAPFQNDVSGLGWLHFSLSEVHLLLAIPLLVFRGWRGNLSWMGPSLWGALFLTVFLTVPNWRGSSAVSLVQMALYWIGAVAVFANLPRNSGDLLMARRILVVVGLALAAAALVNRSSYFWGLNKNGVGASLACSLIVAVEGWISSSSKEARFYRWTLPVIAGGLVIVLSRGAWIAAASGVAFLLAWRGQIRRLVLLVSLMVPVVACVWSFLPEQSREYAVSFDQGRYNIRARTLNTEWAVDQWRQSPWIGVGAGLRKEYDATNALWLTLAETGPLGLLAFIGVHAHCVWGSWIRRKRSGFRGAQSSAIALAGALVASKFVHGLVDHYWSRGAIMMAWASVGMALVRVPDRHPASAREVLQRA